MRVLASPRAVETIVDHGGRLYLWQEPFGGNWLTDRQGFEDPGPSFSFVDHDLEGEFRVVIERGLEPPRELQLLTAWLSPRKLRISWDDARWGRRGKVEGGG
jgi:hypothetical protein